MVCRRQLLCAVSHVLTQPQRELQRITECMEPTETVRSYSSIRYNLQMIIDHWRRKTGGPPGLLVDWPNHTTTADLPVTISGRLETDIFKGTAKEAEPIDWCQMETVPVAGCSLQSGLDGPKGSYIARFDWVSSRSTILSFFVVGGLDKDHMAPVPDLQFRYVSARNSLFVGLNHCLPVTPFDAWQGHNPPLEVQKHKMS